VTNELKNRYDVAAGVQRKLMSSLSSLRSFRLGRP
jgi:hypothetical protein